MPVMRYYWSVAEYAPIRTSELLRYFWRASADLPQRFGIYEN